MELIDLYSTRNYGSVRVVVSFHESPQTKPIACFSGPGVCSSISGLIQA